jgi:hypothetical protein
MAPRFDTYIKRTKLLLHLLSRLTTNQGFLNSQFLLSIHSLSLYCSSAYVSSPCYQSIAMPSRAFPQLFRSKPRNIRNLEIKVVGGYFVGDKDVSNVTLLLLSRSSTLTLNENDRHLPVIQLPPQVRHLLAVQSQLNCRR